MSGGRARPTPRIVGSAGMLAAVVFSALFRLRRLGPLDFWSWLALDIVLVVAVSFIVDGRYGARLRDDVGSGLTKKAGIGVASAVILYFVFAAGRLAALRLFPFAGAGIGGVYALREGVSTVRISLLIGLIIGPGEEIFWRGFFQEWTGAAAGRTYGLVVTALLYTVVHVASGNVMLVSAAAVCGVFWGWLYQRFRSPVLNMISHTVWDLLVFVFFPF